jgi:hypothetical protein
LCAQADLKGPRVAFFWEGNLGLKKNGSTFSVRERESPRIMVWWRCPEDLRYEDDFTFVALAPEIHDSKDPGFCRPEEVAVAAEGGVSKDERGWALPSKGATQRDPSSANAATAGSTVQHGAPLESSRSTGGWTSLAVSEVEPGGTLRSASNTRHLIARLLTPCGHAKRRSLANAFCADPYHPPPRPLRRRATSLRLDHRAWSRVLAARQAPPPAPPPPPRPFLPSPHLAGVCVRPA